jgi:hypothetical protein
MELVYRDTRMIVNLSEMGRDKEAMYYNFIGTGPMNLQLLPAMLYFFSL